METIRSLLEQVGEVADASPALRGGVVVGTALLAAGGLAWRLARGRPKERAVVRVDAPAGENVQVRVGRRPRVEI